MNFDLQDLMKGIQAVQKEMGDSQEKLKAIEEEASVGGELVTVRMNGHREVVGIKIDPVAVDPRDVKMLEELLIAACGACLEKIKERIKSEALMSMGGSFPFGEGS